MSQLLHARLRLAKIVFDSWLDIAYNTYMFNKNIEGNNMKAFILGTVFGLVLATVGFSGIARMLDKGVDSVKTQSTELAK